MSCEPLSFPASNPVSPAWPRLKRLNSTDIACFGVWRGERRLASCASKTLSLVDCRSGVHCYLYPGKELTLLPFFQPKAAQKFWGHPQPLESECRLCQVGPGSVASSDLTCFPHSCSACECRAQSQSYLLPCSTGRTDTPALMSSTKAHDRSDCTASHWHCRRLPHRCPQDCLYSCACTASAPVSKSFALWP